MKDCDIVKVLDINRSTCEKIAIHTLLQKGTIATRG
jgi:hypothetical protein